MKLRVYFDGYELTEYLKVSGGFSRGIGTGRQNDLLQVGNSNGAKYRGHRLEENSFPMPFTIKHNLIEKRRALASILNVSEPKKLIFSDEPDKYYLAVPEGVTDLTENNFLGNGEINWVIPDGVAYAAEEKTFKNEPETTKVIVSDFNTPPKVAGSIVENANLFKRNSSTTVPLPSSGSWAENAQTHYDAVKKLDGATAIFTYSNGGIAAGLISFDVLWILEENFPSIFKNAATTAEKVEIAKNKITNWRTFFFCKGSAPVGNYVAMKTFYQGTGWTSLASHKNAEISELSYPNGSDSMGFINSDGYIHSVIYTDASNATVSSSVSIDYARIELTVKVPPSNYIDVENTGTYPVFPLLNVEMNGDNGVVGLFTEEGAIIQIGNPDEIDGVPYQKQEMVIDERWNGTSMPANWSKNTGKIRYTTYVANGQQNIVKGEWDFTTDADAVRPSYSGNLEPVWAGPTLHRDIPKNSNGSNTANFTYKNRFTFDAINRTVGRIELNLQSGDDIPLSFVMRDSSTSNAEIRYEIWIQGKRYIDKALDRSRFSSGFFQVEINKYAGQIEFKIVDIKSISNEVVTGSSVEIQSWFVQDMNDVPITSLTTWIHRFQNESWTGIHLTDTKFTWLNVDKWNDLKNTFGDGDILSIDTSSAAIAVNGAQSTVLGALGNEWDRFAIPPGKHKIYIYPSSWATAPDVTLTIREAYL
ncbi:distal tail protein Dit [Carnobacterium sp. FSL E2-0243]|uniref:distal tail protein Dit n=1 Tax=Carnobacterium sp. FSL E2-0243 TaxID=2921365 RepID=UPI0030F5DDCB